MSALSSPTEQTDTRSFCSVQTSMSGAAPLGTAPMVDEFLMVELALPWPEHIEASPDLPPGATAAVATLRQSGRRVQVLALAPPPELSEPGRRRVMHFRRPPEAAADDEASFVSDFVGVEYVVAEEDVAPLVRFLLLGEGDGEAFAQGKVPRGAVDLFVSTHRERDACCGEFGLPLQQALAALVEKEQANIRVWRTSHLGGHQFAPTMLHMPSGRYWGSLSEDVLPAFLKEVTDLVPLLPYHRGWSGVLSPEEQVAEAEAWRNVGPDWHRYERWLWTSASQKDPELTSVAIEWSDPETGKDGRIEVDVAVSHVVSYPEGCGGGKVEAKQWWVVRYEEA